MAEYTQVQLCEMLARMRRDGRASLGFGELTDLLAGYGLLVTERDTLRAELATVKAALPRWKKKGCAVRLTTDRCGVIGTVRTWGGQWMAYTVMMTRVCQTREAAMTAVTEALGLPPCEVCE